MKTRRELTIDEHTALGKELWDMRNTLISRTVQICKAYGSSKKSTKLADKACSMLDKLRCEMDSQFCRDYPDKFTTHIYYPANTGPKG